MASRRAVLLPAAAALVALLASPVLAAPPVVKTVPWNPAGGVYTNPHTTYSGYNMLLMGVVEDADGDLSSYEWSFGDGSPTVSGGLGGGGPANLEVRHVYAGSVGTPFTATLEVCDAAANCTTDTFRVQIGAMSLDIEVNIAIDEGLWYLHKGISKTTLGTEPAGYWYTYGSFTLSSTSSAVQAFAINEHLPPLAGGDPDEDPYIDTVIRGTNWMLDLLTRVNGPFSGNCGDPDVTGNGNGYVLGVNSSRPLYEQGQVMDGLAALRTPTATAVTGGSGVLGMTYQEIAEDMAEYYGWCQVDGSGGARGGWRYSCNYDSDNSAAQWGAIGLLGVEQGFGIPTPACVKTENELWLNYSRHASGYFGYNYSGSCVDYCRSTTPSGMTELALDDIPTTDFRWVDAEKWLCDRWDSLFQPSNNLYAYYALAKAMRSAVGGTDDWVGDDASNPCANPVEWYAGEPRGLARQLVNTQSSYGYWNSSVWGIGGYLSTAWGVIVLKPTLVCPAPIARCTADPAATTTECPVEFDGTESYHPGAVYSPPGCGTEIVSYEWDFDDGNTATGVVATHSFATEDVFNVTLTVTDDIGNSSFAICAVDVDPPPVTPNADPNGPYEYCIGIDHMLVLDGSASRDPDNSPCVAGNGIASYAWEIDFAEFPRDFDDAFGATTDQTAYYEAAGPGVYNVGLRVTDDEADTNDDYTTVTVYSREDCPPRPCPNEPVSQGYWHRQCLGVPASEGGIDPGRNGRGPQSPTEPYFVEELMTCAEDRLAEIGFYELTTCDGMDADPPSDPCERAYKQLTALILNVCSYRLTDQCFVDVTEAGCSATTVGELITEIADLIAMDECSTAASCADAVNSGYGVVDGSGGGSVELLSLQPYMPSPAPEGIAPLYIGGVEQLDPNIFRPGPMDLVKPDRPSRRIQRTLRSDTGVIVYYLVPREYVPDDPQIVIGSWAESDPAVEPRAPERKIRKEKGSRHRRR